MTVYIVFHNPLTITPYSKCDIIVFINIITIINCIITNLIIIMLHSPPGMVQKIPLVVTRMMIAVRRAHMQCRRVGVQRGARGPVIWVSRRPHRRRRRSALVGLLRPASKNNER